MRFVGLDMPGADPFYKELDVPFERLAAVAAARRVEARAVGPRHTHLVHADVYGAVSTRTPIVSTKHNPDPFRAGLWRFAERVLARRARRIIAISDAVRRFSIDEVGLPEDKVEVIHYGLDALPESWERTPSCRSRTTSRCCSVLRGSHRRRASTSRSARCRRSPTRRCSC